MVPKEKSCPRLGGFFILWSFIVLKLIVLKLVAEVFNMFVENTVEKCVGIFVSDSLRDASALCTGASAGTFRLGPVDERST